MEYQHYGKQNSTQNSDMYKTLGGSVSVTMSGPFTGLAADLSTGAYALTCQKSTTERHWPATIVLTLNAGIGCPSLRMFQELKIIQEPSRFSLRGPLRRGSPAWSHPKTHSTPHITKVSKVQ